MNTFEGFPSQFGHDPRDERTESHVLTVTDRGPKGKDSESPDMTLAVTDQPPDAEPTDMSLTATGPDSTELDFGTDRHGTHFYRTALHGTRFTIQTHSRSHSWTLGQGDSFVADHIHLRFCFLLTHHNIMASSSSNRLRQAGWELSTAEAKAPEFARSHHHPSGSNRCVSFLCVHFWSNLTRDAPWLIS